MRGALVPQDLDRRNGFEHGPKCPPLCADPMRGMGGRAGQEKERRERRWGGEMRREEEGREVDGEKAVGSIKLIEFTTYCENVPPKEIFS